MDRRSSPAAVVDRPPGGKKLPRVITGRAVPYNTPTDLGNVVETIDRGAFVDSLNRVSAIPLLTYHDSRTDPVGVATGWEHRADGLHGTWELDDSERAREVARLVQRGMLRFFSIGFQLQDSLWSTRDNREHVRVMQGRLLEVSLVTTPAYADAAVLGMRSAPAAVADLARRVGAPMLTAAITGTETDVRTAAGLVRGFVEEYGHDAPGRLADLAMSTKDPVLATNLARASSALEDADRRRLSRMFTDRLLVDVKPHRGADTRPAPRRRGWRG